MSATGLATAADYSEALSVARRAKSLLALLLLLMLLGQLAIFLLVRYHVVPLPGAVAYDIAATQPGEQSARWTDLFHYLSGITVLGGITLGILLALVLMLIAHIMLVGRLIGVGKVTSSVVWALVLIVFLFPWQCFMQTDFRVCGVLWTWEELTRGVYFVNNFSSTGWASTVMGWFRFAGAPAVAIIITLIVQLRSNRGIRMAMGEDEVLNHMLGENVR
ncbi:MAG: hypothetical protein H7144_16010 [Burkholderiales bacterium]|nr:hypothetical protein [Phycisphaerae bacterium]